MEIPPKPTTVEDIHQGKWLRCSDLKGKSVPVKIDSADFEFLELWDPILKRKKAGEWRTVVHFSSVNKGYQFKPMIANKTQETALKNILKSSYPTEWAERTVLLKPGRTSAGKDTIDIAQE
jgi:hypothetical protein